VTNVISTGILTGLKLKSLYARLQTVKTTSIGRPMYVSGPAVNVNTELRPAVLKGMHASKTIASDGTKAILFLKTSFCK